MEKGENNSFDDLKKLSETDLKQIEENNDLKSVEELKNVLDTLDSSMVKLTLHLTNSGEADDERKLRGEMYKDFINDVNEIVRDGIISKVELGRLESINRIINSILDSSIFLSTVNNELLKKENIDLPKFKSIKNLVYSRKILDKISDDNEAIEGLKTILGLIENVGTSNINESELKEINILIEEIFDNGLEKKDIVNLNKLQTLLLVTYNTEQNQKYENFSFNEEEEKKLTEGLNFKEKIDKENEIKTTQEILDMFYDIDKSWDSMNEMSPTLGNFMDSLAVEIKDGLKGKELNTLGASLRVILDRFLSIQKSFDKIDYNDPKSIIKFSNDLTGFNKDPIILNALNSLRFIIPRTVNLIFIGIKEVKNYYLKSTGPETEHGVFVQKMHMLRDEVKDGDYTFDWLKDIAGAGADVADNTIIDGLSVINGGTDAILDFSGTLLNTVFLPEKTIAKISDFTGNMGNNLNIFGNFILKDLNQEKIAQALYISSYITTYITATTLIPGLGWANTKVNNLLDSLARIIGKPISQLTKIIEKGLKTIKQSDKFKKIEKIVDKSINTNQTVKKSVENAGVLTKADKLSGKVTAGTQTNTYQNNIDYKINKSA